MSTPNRKKKQRPRAVPREVPSREVLSSKAEELQFEETAAVEETEPIVSTPVAVVEPTDHEGSNDANVEILQGLDELDSAEDAEVRSAPTSQSVEAPTPILPVVHNAGPDANVDANANPNAIADAVPTADVDTRNLSRIEDSARTLTPEHQDLPVDEITSACVECDNPKCAGGNVHGTGLHVNRDRYLREPPELGFDIVIKACASDGRVEKFHFSTYCLTALLYFRTMLTSGLREQKEQEIDLTEFGSDLVLRLLSRLDPLSKVEQPFRTSSAIIARRLLDFINLVGGPLSEYHVISKAEMEYCVHSLSVDPDPTDLARMIDYGLSQYIPMIVNGLIKTHRFKNQSRDWYLGLIIRKELPPKFRSRLAVEFAASGHLTSPGEAALIVEAQTTIRKKLKLLYVAAGDMHLSRAILADLGRQASVEAIPVHVLFNAMASLPAMIRTLKDRGTVGSAPMHIAPQVDLNS